MTRQPHTSAGDTQVIRRLLQAGKIDEREPFVYEVVGTPYTLSRERNPDRYSPTRWEWHVADDESVWGTYLSFEEGYNWVVTHGANPEAAPGMSAAGCHASGARLTPRLSSDRYQDVVGNALNRVFRRGGLDANWSSTVWYVRGNRRSEGTLPEVVIFEDEGSDTLSLVAYDGDDLEPRTLKTWPTGTPAETIVGDARALAAGA